MYIYYICAECGMPGAVNDENGLCEECEQVMQEDDYFYDIEDDES